MSELLKMLGCRYPIIQGPIGMFNSPKNDCLYVEAGAYGMLALGFINNLDEVKKLVDEIRALTDKPFGANIMLINPNNAEILKVLAEAGVSTVTTSVGSPKEVYPVIHGLGDEGNSCGFGSATRVSGGKGRRRCWLLASAPKQVASVLVTQSLPQWYWCRWWLTMLKFPLSPPGDCGFPRL